ncbi:MAG: FAD-dependent oxidoreductase, partial [Anaerolineales bacterium]
DAVLIASGAHQAKKLQIRNANHPDNWLSLDLLERVRLGEAPDLRGKKVAVLGGGNVALDAARTALRLGGPKVSMICLEPRGEMPGFEWEIEVAEEEGIKLYAGRTFKEVVVKDGKIQGIRCVEVEFRGFKGGRPDISEIPGSEHIIPADIVVWAIGQGPDFSFLPQDGSMHIRYPVGVVTDKDMMTSVPGVFCAGDVRRGMTFFVVDAIGEGHHVARSIDRFLRGEDGLQEPYNPPVVELSEEEINRILSQGNGYDRPRASIRSIPLKDRKNNFNEVDLALTEEEAIAEAGRCLECGVCSECLECVAACERGAIHHDMQDQQIDLKVGAIILATGFQDFDPTRFPELGYGKLDNVISAMEFERLINTGGPTDGKVLLRNGEKPKKVAILHCIGSRDERFHEYCSRVCCMYSLKLAQLVHDYVDAEVHEVYRDMRTAGPGYEDFFNRTRDAGVHFHHGHVSSIENVKDQLRVHWDEAYFGEPDHVDVDMVILSTGFEAQSDSAEVAALFGISRSPSGFFLERHPKLAPVETATQGIFIAGACQSPKDIPDSVAQAGGAAAAALSLIDQGTIALEPSIAAVNTSLCAGCGQCIESCPYDAIALSDGVASVNEYLCKGCGTCAGACPNKAMTLVHFDDSQVLSELISILRRPMVGREVEA